MPHDREAEGAVLGAVLLDNAQMAHVRGLLKADSFYVPLHSRAWLAMAALWDEGRAIDPLLVAERMRESGSFQEGDVSAISELTAGLPGVFWNPARYVEIVRRHARRRWLARLGGQLSDRALAGDETEAQLLAWVDARLDAVRPRMAEEKRGPRELAEMEHAQGLRYEKFFRGVSDAVPTGFGEVDRNLTGAGFGRKHLVVVAARPSVGKTALALDMAANAAERGQRALVFSLEMSAEMLLDRLVAVESDVPRWKIQARICEADYRKVTSALPTVCGRKVTIDDGSYTLSEVTRRTREVMRANPVDLIVVDYLQLVGLDARGGTRNDDVGEVSRALKLMAMEWDVPVVALSQLSRNCEAQNRDPELRDLRDSGEIEQNADTVFFLFGDKPEEGASFRDVTLKCAKQREGKLFRVNMPFNGELVTFRSPRSLASTDYDDSAVWAN